MSQPDDPLRLLGPFTGSDTTESVYERQPPKRTGWLLGAAGIVVAAVVIAVVVGIALGGDDEAESSETAALPTTVPAEAADEPADGAVDNAEAADGPDETGATQADVVVADTLPTVEGLPRLRPDALLLALTAGSVAADPGPTNTLYSLDLLDGSAQTVALERPASHLMVVDGTLVARIGRDVMRFDPNERRWLLLAEDTSGLERAYNPDRLVITFDERSSNGSVRARVIGADGVYFSQASFPAEATVHGALGEQIVVSMGGEAWAWDGRTDPIKLGSGRVVALGSSGLVKVRCEATECYLEVTFIDVAAPQERREEWCEQRCSNEANRETDPQQAERLRTVCLDVCRTQEVIVDEASRRRIEIPRLLAGSSAEHWADVGVVSPSGRLLALHLTKVGGNVRGVVAIDLESGRAAHSPEQGVDLGDIAWSPFSKFVAYTFDGDVMVWQPDFAGGVGPSGRVMVGERLESLALS